MCGLMMRKNSCESLSKSSYTNVAWTRRDFPSLLLLQFAAFELSQCIKKQKKKLTEEKRKDKVNFIFCIGRESTFTIRKRKIELPLRFSGTFIFFLASIPNMYLSGNLYY
ncbi:hypothetical protein L6164_019709 [Bauhinia variegata]|uniref:Uncharacterized protein n=1 Tax=Bauhinia variegata TaxID=167791 RepID=A0ACB9MU25_BAUVA|nr:hypothetical protein L6164_019709 [Bauhinia variegata]